MFLFLRACFANQKHTAPSLFPTVSINHINIQSLPPVNNPVNTFPLIYYLYNISHQQSLFLYLIQLPIISHLPLSSLPRNILYYSHRFFQLYTNTQETHAKHALESVDNPKSFAIIQNSF